MIHKLATGPVTLLIAGIESAEGNFGPQMVIRGNDGTDVYISEMSGLRGLARLNLTPETAVGQTLLLEQVKKDGKTFTNISFAASGATTGAAPIAAAAPVAAAPKLTVPELGAIYFECVNQAMGTLGMKCEEAGIPIDAAAIQSAAATLFIRAMR